ncbi:hypothetical protein HO133_000709 [Letharia lupina]|uniref:Uncharacterized protein n=1 Tax=Letharia lupina TaxID=560253 RepID=A0A8H6CFQ0_9LECA|nr:uncharacterized protein HO133_000709 [Letharia lupina]KAF6222662.1 hypothetical protein HO133_000709 [Letharia lupina]
MSQPPGPQEEHSIIDYRPSARPGEPELDDAALPLYYRIVLYHGVLGTGRAQVQQLISLKTGGAVASCGLFEQHKIKKTAKNISENKDHPWDWNGYNIGKFLASGLTQPKDLELVVGLTEEEIKGIKNGEKHFPPNHRARTKDSNAYRGAAERLLENRAYFKERVEVEERIRQAGQAMQAPPSQATYDSLADQAYLVGQASLAIATSKGPGK